MASPSASSKTHFISFPRPFPSVWSRWGKKKKRGKRKEKKGVEKKRRKFSSPLAAMKFAFVLLAFVAVATVRFFPLTSLFSSVSNSPHFFDLAHPITAKHICRRNPASTPPPRLFPSAPPLWRSTSSTVTFLRFLLWTFCAPPPSLRSTDIPLFFFRCCPLATVSQLASSMSLPLAAMSRSSSTRRSRTAPRSPSVRRRTSTSL